jgi:hypothetical protein
MRFYNLNKSSSPLHWMTGSGFRPLPKIPHCCLQRSMGLIQIPLWLFVLPDQLSVIGLVNVITNSWYSLSIPDGGQPFILNLWKIHKFNFIKHLNVNPPDYAISFTHLHATYKTICSFTFNLHVLSLQWLAFTQSQSQTPTFVLSEWTHHD